MPRASSRSPGSSWSTSHPPGLTSSYRPFGGPGRAGLRDPHQPDGLPLGLLGVGTDQAAVPQAAQGGEDRVPSERRALSRGYDRKGGLTTTRTRSPALLSQPKVTGRGQDQHSQDLFAVVPDIPGEAMGRFGFHRCKEHRPVSSKVSQG